MELVDEDVRTLAAFPVQSDTVEHRVSDDQQAGRLKLSTKAMDIEHDNSLIEVDVALFAEDVQRTGGIKLKRQSDLFCFRLWLFKQLL